MFRMKSKPIKPTRKARYNDSFEVYDTESLDAIYQKVRDRGGDPSEATVEKEYGYYDTFTVEIKFPTYESEEAYKKRLEKYEEKFNAWKQWYDANESEILKVQAKKREAAERKAKLKIEAETIRLQKELKKLEKQAKKYI